MTDIIKLVQNDTKPLITVTLTDESTGLAYDVSAGTTTVNVYFRAAGSTATASTIACTKTNGGADGVVEFDFSGDVLLDITPGMYEGEIEVDINGDTHTVYDKLKFRVRGQIG